MKDAEPRPCDSVWNAVTHSTADVSVCTAWGRAGARWATRLFRRHWITQAPGQVQRCQWPLYLHTVPFLLTKQCFLSEDCNKDLHWCDSTEVISVSAKALRSDRSSWKDSGTDPQILGPFLELLWVILILEACDLCVHKSTEKTSHLVICTLSNASDCGQQHSFWEHSLIVKLQ